jgi:hypothetical protein
VVTFTPRGPIGQGFIRLKGKTIVGDVVNFWNDRVFYPAGQNADIAYNA